MSNFASAIYPFGHYSYRHLWGSNLTSNMSQMMQMTLLVWFVLEQTDSPFLVSLVGTFSFAPTLFLGVFGGVLSDRIDRRRLLIGTQCVNLLATLIFAILLNTDLYSDNSREIRSGELPFLGKDTEFLLRCGGHILPGRPTLQPNVRTCDRWWTHSMDQRWGGVPSSHYIMHCLFNAGSVVKKRSVPKAGKDFKGTKSATF